MTYTSKDLSQVKYGETCWLMTCPTFLLILDHKQKHKRRSLFYKLYTIVLLHAFCSDVAFNIEILYMSIVIEFYESGTLWKVAGGDINCGHRAWGPTRICLLDPFEIVLTSHLFTWTVNSANRVLMTNSPGRMSVSMLTVEGNRVRSLGAPHGSIWLDVRRSMVGGTLSSTIRLKRVKCNNLC